MGRMQVEAGMEKPAGTEPKAKSRNKKSIGPSRRVSSGTLKTETGSKAGSKRKPGRRISPKAAGEKKGTVFLSSKESRGEKPGNITARRKAVSGSRSSKRPVSKSRGKNSSASSSRPFGQP
jgi:hypothetical protein